MARGVRRSERRLRASSTRSGARLAAARSYEVRYPHENVSRDVGTAVVIRRSVKAARVRVLATGEVLTVRANDLWHVMPGHVVTLVLKRRWRHLGHLYGEGELRDARIDVPALGLPKLRLEQRGPLEVNDETRTAYKMDQVLPGTTPRSNFDPILVAIARKKRGDLRGAALVLMDLLADDLRCLDAHVHLGNIVFPTYPEHALIHYEIGVAIGEHALGPAFTGALPWSYLDNRPFLRCLCAQGLALWRLGRLEEAARALERVLWLNPADGQGAGRFLADVQAGRPWEEDDGEEDDGEEDDGEEG